MPDDTPLTKADFDAGLQNLKDDLKEYIDERTHDAETRLLRAFADYKLEKQSTDFKLRLISLEGQRESQY
jgi:hypothetical protein